MQTVTLARNAMATRFEIVLHGENAVSLRAAGEEALNEIEQLEARLSLYRSTSEIAHVNARAAREPVRVTPEVFALIRKAQILSAETDGAFDITVAPLVRCWGFMGGTGKLPDPESLAQARALVGMHLVHLNAADFTIQFAREGVMLDLGAIGKGYAVERAGELLRDAGVSSALVHGGTSTVFAIGSPPDAAAWKIAIDKPRNNAPADNSPPPSALDAPRRDLLAAIPLKDEALSVSAVWGKSFQAEGKSFGHMLDPRSGNPCANALLAAVVLPSGTETDAFSTALLVRGSGGHEKISALREGMKTLLAIPDNEGFRTEAKGITLEISG